MSSSRIYSCRLLSTVLRKYKISADFLLFPFLFHRCIFLHKQIYTMAIPFRQTQQRKQSRQLSTDPRNELHPQVDHYIGIDVGTGSARACIMNDQGDIVGLASENIGLWQPQTGYYVICSVSGKTFGKLNKDRNNPQRTFGDASAPRFVGQWTSTTLTRTPYVVLASTPHAPSLSSETTRTNLSQ